MCCGCVKNGVLIGLGERSLAMSTLTVFTIIPIPSKLVALQQNKTDQKLARDALVAIAVEIVIQL